MYEKGYGDWDNDFHIVVLRKMSPSDRLKYIKKLWLDNPSAYKEWKEECLQLNQLPELFGTHDNPILIDESKL